MTYARLSHLSTSLSFNARADYDKAKEWQILNKPSNVRSRSAPARRKEPISLVDLCPGASETPPTQSTRSRSSKLTLALGLYNADMEQYELNVRSWPRRSEIHESVVDVLFAHGFVPDPETFHQPHPNGYGGHPTVFSFLETCLHKDADPSSRIYACVAPGVARDHMLCLVTKVPLFEFHFSVLRRCRQAALRDGFSGFELLGEELCNKELSEAAKAGSVDLSLALGPRSLVRLGLSRPPTEDFTADCSLWVADWATKSLLQEMPKVFGPELLTLLALVLQEHRILLVGETRHVNKLALLLHALLQPFRWHHLFLPAAVPPRNQFAAFEECPVPMIVAREVLSEEYKNFNMLPKSLIPVRVSPEGIALEGWNFASKLTKAMISTKDGGFMAGVFERCCGFQSGVPADVLDPDQGIDSRPIIAFPEHRQLCKELARVMKSWQRAQSLESSELEQTAAALMRVLTTGVSDAARVVKGFASATAERHRSADLADVLRDCYNIKSFMDWYGTGGHRFGADRWQRFFASLVDSQTCADLFVEEFREQQSAMNHISGASARSAAFCVEQ